MRPALAALAALALATPALAQDPGEGWDLETGADGAIVASVTYTGGVGLAVRCRAGVLDTAILGLPAAAAGEIDQYRRRRLATGFDPDALVEAGWKAVEGSTVAGAVMAGRQARQLKRGGVFRVRTVPGESGAVPGRMEIPTPADGAAIDRVLGACDTATTDDRDDLLLIGDLLTPDVWEESRPFEMPAPTPSEGGGLRQVEVSCVFAPAGRLRDCRVESESQPGLGARMLRDTHNVRFPFAAEAAAAAEGRLIHIVVTGSVIRRPPRR